MATLMACPTCGKAVSSSAWSCPHCGETEFEEPVYKKVACRYCEGTKVEKIYHTLTEIRRLKGSTSRFESRADSSIMLKNGFNKRDFQNRVIEAALRLNQFVGFTPKYEVMQYEYGDFEYYHTEPCSWCDGKGYHEEYVGRRDRRKPYK